MCSCSALDNRSRGLASTLAANRSQLRPDDNETAHNQGGRHDRRKKLRTGVARQTGVDAFHLKRKDEKEQTG